MQECQSSQELFDYLRQELPPEQVARMEAHLSHCAACRDELNGLRQQIQQVQAILAQLDPVPDRLPARSASFIRLPRWALAFAAMVMLILGAVMHLSGNQSALANSISRLKVIIEVSTGLDRATSMDCTLKIPDAGGLASNYRVRWSAAGITRVDLDPGSGMEKTLWISNTSNPPDPVWQPVMEFLTPAILAQHMEKRYGLMQTGGGEGTGQHEFLLVGQENRQAIEIAVNGGTYLPTVLKKYSQDSGRTGAPRPCLMEVRFLWNRPIPRELFIAGSHGAN